MKKKTGKSVILTAVVLMVFITACQSRASQKQELGVQSAGMTDVVDGVYEAYTTDTLIATVISDPVFGD